MIGPDYVGNELDVFKGAVNWKSYWATQISPLIRGRVLEVGAGIGSSTLALQFAEYSKWTCLEPDPKLANRLNRLLGNENLKGDHEVVTGALTDLPDSASYETIIYIDVLEHIEDDGSELMNASGRLKKDGLLIVLAPAHQFLFSQFDLAIGHCRRYSRKALLEAAPAELTLVRVNFLDSVGLLASLANRLLLHSEAPSQAQVAFWDNVLIPFSRAADPLLFRKIGKSILAIWRKDYSSESAVRK
jgi:SAM-dependent methyltransferase